MALSKRRGIGAHVMKTARSRKDFLPHASDRAPNRGADRKDRVPCTYNHTYTYTYTVPAQT